MKITDKDYQDLKQAIAYAVETLPHKLIHYKEGYYTNGLSERRLCSDLLLQAMSEKILHITDGIGITDHPDYKYNIPLYSYMNDDHIYTALKRIVSELTEND